MEIQIYEMEVNVYLVDFKCAGYERDDGTMLEEKDVMSPFPFLDMAAKLACLARTTPNRSARIPDVGRRRVALHW